MSENFLSITAEWYTCSTVSLNAKRFKLLLYSITLRTQPLLAHQILCALLAFGMCLIWKKFVQKACNGIVSFGEHRLLLHAAI